MCMRKISLRCMEVLHAAGAAAQTTVTGPNLPGPAGRYTAPAGPSFFACCMLAS